MSETSAFLDTIADLRLLADTDRHAAIDAARDILDLADPAEREFLDGLVRTFTLHPYPTAMQLLEQQYEAEPYNRDRLAILTADTDPHLYLRDSTHRSTVVADHLLGAEYLYPDASLLAALPRQSIRLWRNPPARLEVEPAPETDDSRETDEQQQRRARARAKRRPTVRDPKVVRDYVAENLYVDTMAREIAGAQALDERRAARGLVRPSTESTSAHHKPIRDSDEVRAVWDHQFVHYVAEQRHRAIALAGRRPISEDNALIHADKRTTLRGDRRAPIPTGGNGLDYDHEAMSPITGWRCVSCFIERPLADQYVVHARNGIRRSDDGLCDMCRTDDTVARLPELPAGATAADLARTYCRFLTDTYPHAVQGILAEVRHRAPQWLTIIVDGYLPAEPVDRPAPEPVTVAALTRRTRGMVAGAGQHRARCQGCTRIRAVNDQDGYCTECRVWLGLATATPRTRVAA
ncbi:hypothetical protein ABIA39_004506 [Nocardia sp. GAS34]|uniref:hypothetical protein n=1 Tax=unclassified Nocardia TaxID=2637762 RepID=UPI003D23FCD7